MRFVVEHLEPELYEWCLIEYEHISKIVDKNNLIFTNINKKKKNKRENSKKEFSGVHKDKLYEQLKKYGKVYGKSISELDFSNTCVLSQYSKNTLKTEDKNKFKYFVFGGILGDSPAKKRTLDLIKKLKKHKIKFEERSLGNKQMPTDVAVYVAKKILEGRKLSDFRFVNEIEIEVNENESVVLPFRFVVDDKKLVINEKLVEHLRKREGF